MKAIIYYWYKDLSAITGYPEETEISEDKIMETVKSIYGDGLNVMLQHQYFNDKDSGMVIWVDDKRFQQR